MRSTSSNVEPVRSSCAKSTIPPSIAAATDGVRAAGVGRQLVHLTRSDYVPDGRPVRIRRHTPGCARSAHGRGANCHRRDSTSPVQEGGGTMWDTVQTNDEHLSHDMPCPRCGHALHTFLACGELRLRARGACPASSRCSPPDQPPSHDRSSDPPRSARCRPAAQAVRRPSPPCAASRTRAGRRAPRRRTSGSAAGRRAARARPGCCRTRGRW